MRRIVIALLATILVTACSDSGKPAFKNVDITGATQPRGFELTDHDGKPRTLTEFKGKVVTVFFGFAQCPDVCPTTLAEMKSVISALGPAGRDVQVIFVTVDPERDTEPLLKAYVTAFDPSFLGMYASLPALPALAKEFKVFYQKVPSKTDPKQYSIDHTAGTYVFDRAGRIRLFVRHGQGVDMLAGDLKLLLAEKN
jgi:protein SCO1